MRHLPKTEYTETDQRADTNFLIGARYGRDRALADLRRQLAEAWDAGFDACVEQSALYKLDNTHPFTRGNPHSDSAPVVHRLRVRPIERLSHYPDLTQPTSEEGPA